MCEWERIREQIIAEREEEWQKLKCSKSEFDKVEEKEKVRSKKPKKQQQDTGLTFLRRSSRKTKPKSYKEDDIPGRFLNRLLNKYSNFGSFD